MSTEEKNKQLAFLYFEGKISFEEENQLYEFIQLSEENNVQFRLWEAEWETTLSYATEVHPDWLQLKSRLVEREQKTFRLSSPNLSKYLAVAASFLLVLLSTYTFLIREDSTNQQSNLIVEAPMGEKSKLTLSDGSIVWLNSGSILTIEESKKKSSMTVHLEGEAYFDVAKNSERKFIVKTSAYDVEVVGTKFNVVSYPADRFVTTTLIEGKIMLVNEVGVVEVAPGEKAYYDKTSKLIQKERVPEASNSYAWIESTIVYDDISLNDLIEHLSRAYDVKIVLETKELGLKKLSIALRNHETITEVVQALEKILNIEVKKDGKNYYIKQTTN